MPEDMINDLDFEKKIKEMTDRELNEFSAREIFKAKKLIYVLQKKVLGNGEAGLCKKVELVEESLANTVKSVSDSRKLVLAMWGFNMVLLTSILGLVIKHITGG